ncbi:hypothetical protein [Poseidonocella sp. HB161398]|uniref:hypothetical protein n=1 Tax=Poseidonocella sp. HB161398 TaxID=2320855 RepID=UPI00110840FF|nr:hypothetical protein [Poseidonocella sp. HB161398]
MPRLPKLFRHKPAQISPVRLLRGGRLLDRGRLPRYALIFLLGSAALWAPIGLYLAKAPLRYRTQMSLILPGSGASASVNLDRIGQASSSSSSPFASSSVSPTETYKRLLGAERILDAAALSVGVAPEAFGKPRVELVDQTGLIHVSLTDGSAEGAKARGDALLAAFFTEIEALRSDEISMREISAGDAISEYRTSVQTTRAEISALQRATGLVSGEQYRALAAETDALGERLRDLAATLAEKTEAVRALQSALRTTPALAAAALRLHADTEFAALATRMAEQAAELSQVQAQFGARHPLVTTAQGGFEAAQRETMLRAAVLTGLDRDALGGLDLSHVGNRAALLSDLVTAEAERAGLAAEVAAMSERLERAEARRRELLEPAARLEDLQRDFSVAEAVFASAMARSQATKTDLYASYPLVQVLEDPSLPDAPSSPNRLMAFAAGVAGTMFLGFGLFLGWVRRPLIDRLLASAPERAPAPILAAAE